MPHRIYGVNHHPATLRLLTSAYEAAMEELLPRTPAHARQEVRDAVATAVLELAAAGHTDLVALVASAIERGAMVQGVEASDSRHVEISEKPLASTH